MRYSGDGAVVAGDGDGTDHDAVEYNRSGAVRTEFGDVSIRGDESHFASNGIP